MKTTFQGRSALVTGGGSGIVLALTRRLVAMGARVVVADLDADAANRAAHVIATSSDTSAGKLLTPPGIRDCRNAMLRSAAGSRAAGVGGEPKSLSPHPWTHLEWSKEIDQTTARTRRAVGAAFP